MPIDEPKSLLNILVIGIGWREHALLRKLKDETGIGNIHTVPVKPDIPPSPGILGEWAKIIDANPQEAPLDIRDATALIAYIRAHNIQLVVIGPEDPLCNGTADVLRASGIAVFWPDKDAARLEWDKSFADAFNKKHAIPAPQSETFWDQAVALQYLENTNQYPIVIKYPGLAGGKGVTIAKNEQEAKEAIWKCFDGKTYNKEGAVIVQEYLRWIEMSVFFFVDTHSGTIQYFSSAQDHKTRFEIDFHGINPMTWGMGTVSPSPFEKHPEVMEKVHAIWEKFLAGLLSDGIKYQWAVFMGLMVTSDGSKMLEYNVRFGDPETQAMLARMQSPLGDAMMATAEGLGRLRDVQFRFYGKAINLVLADPGYPGKTETSWYTIQWLKNLDPELGVIHSGTRWAVGEQEILTNGGRVLWLVLRWDDDTTFAGLNARVLKEATKITFGNEKPGYRTDIGLGKDGV